MALNVGQLLAPPAGSLVGAVKQGTGVTIDGDGTISISGGGDFPLTTINFPTTVPGTANTTWADNPSLIYATGCIEFSINGGSFGQGARVIDTGDALTTQWLTSVECGGAPHGTTIIGTITDSTYSESSTFTIDRVPNAFLFGNLTEQPLSSVVTSNPLVPTGFNATTYVTLNAGNTLTSVQASAGGGAFTAIPASGTTLPLNPGQSLQIQGTTGGAINTTYSATVNLGVTGNVVSDTWDVTTTSVAASIAQPSILTPPSGTTGLNPAFNTPEGITLTASSYTPLNGAGAQTSSVWEVTSGSAGGTPITGSPFTDTSSPFNTLFIPQSSLAVSTNYYARVQYATTNSQAATSPFSAWSSFGTAASFPPAPGTPMGGGYFAGQIVGAGSTTGGGLDDLGVIYNLIVAPVTGDGSQEGQVGGAIPGRIRYDTLGGSDGGATLDEAYGALATANFADANHPMFNWCVNGPNGPRSNGGIGGFTDWYIPAKNELAILYFFLKPTANGSATDSGSNPNSVAPYTPNTNYGLGFPNQTTSTLFQAGGAQAFPTNDYYWSSNENPSFTANALGLDFNSGSQSNGLAKVSGYYARAIRRVLA